MGLEFEDDDTPAQSLGRFDVEERTDGRVRLVARSRTQTHAMRWGRWPAAVVLVGLCGWGATLNPVMPCFLLGMGGVMYAVIVMIDFTRLAALGVFSTVEHSLEIEATRPLAYRDGDGKSRVLVDGKP